MALDTIQLQDVVDIIQAQFDVVLSNVKTAYPELASKITAVKVSNSQVFQSVENEVIRRNRATIWVVVSFQSGSANFGANSYPVSLSVFGFPNSINPTQVILTQFVKTWTTKSLGEGLNGVSDNYASSTQIWNTPSIFSNFGEAADHFRSTFSVSGVVVLGVNTVKLGSLKYYTGIPDPETGTEIVEDIDFMQFNSDYRASPNPQPFGNTNGFSVTEINFSTDTFSISTYLLDTQLVADAFNIKGYRPLSASYPNAKTSTKLPNDSFKIILTFTNGYTNAVSEEMFQNWKLVSFGIDQPLGSLTRMTLTFTH